MKLPESYRKPLLIAAVLVAMGVVIHVRQHAAPEPSPMQEPRLEFKPKEAGPPELALVAPLKKGGQLLDYEIKAINGVENSVIEIVLAKGAGTIGLTLALASNTGPLAPVTAGRYAIFNSRQDAAEEDVGRLTSALVEILKANSGVPVPPGLSAHPTPPAPLK
jgi:hypothetical protein